MKTEEALKRLVDEKFSDLSKQELELILKIMKKVKSKKKS
jgi:hypothetical protein